MKSTSLIIAICLMPSVVAAQVDFARDIKPILSANCFQCHGPDSKKREADLRLDVDREGFENVLGNVDESLMIQRITSDDPDEMMPPPSSKKTKLSVSQIGLIKKWIASGANVEGHWSYSKVQRPKLPKVKDANWGRNPIDRFVLAKLESKGLKPSRRADYETLARRISLDLVGLPVASSIDSNLVINDLGQMVDQLLASPAFGERMSIDWLDLVRYADTSGIHSDNPISMSPYRDYVIDAFNSGMPFDRFTIEQLAGDLLPNATLEQKVASAFNRLNMMTTEGGAQDKEYLAKYAADRVRTTSTTWLGSTFGCAECHDHKYDPFTTRDFYQFAAFFADITEKGYYPGAERSGDWGPKLEIPTPLELKAYEAIKKGISQVEKEIENEKFKALKNLDQWEKSLGKYDRWLSFDSESVQAKSKTRFKRLGDGSYLTQGNRADTDIYYVATKKVPDKIHAIRIDLIPHDSLPQNGSGRAGNGNSVLTEIKLELKKQDKSQFSKFKEAYSTFDQSLAGEHTPYGKWHALSAIDGDRHGPKPGWAILPKVNEINSAVFVLEKPLDANPADEVIIHLEQRHDNPGHVIGRFKVSYLREFKKSDIRSLTVSPQIIAALKQKFELRTPSQRKSIEEYYFTRVPKIVDLKIKLEKQKKDLVEERKKWVTVLTTVARKPRTMRILPRGNWLDESGSIVTSRYPAFLNIGNEDSQGKTLTRLDLAKWMVSAENPLVARVQVNRIWKRLFGRGLVSTLDDFGSQGNVPTHPELLDFLASELMDSGWNTKYLIRLIVGSATYQQSSSSNPALDEMDPNNELLARQNRFRVDAEVVRDQALATSGLLVTEIGGPSVRPYQPKGYYQHLNFPKRTYQPDEGASQYRKGIYTHWQRLFLHPSLLAFDAPSREECTAERVRSNTPQQALVLLNDPSFVETARVFAEKIISAEKATLDRIRFAFLRALGREPTENEVEVIKRIYMSSLSDANKEKANEILSVGFTKQGDDLELIAWTSVARVIFNLHEFTTRY